MFYTRGSSEEYDRIAKITGDNRWSWNNILSYSKKVYILSVPREEATLIDLFIQSETFVPPTDGRDVTGDYDPNVYGNKGPILVTLPNEITPIHRKVKEGELTMGIIQGSYAHNRLVFSPTAALEHPDFEWNPDTNAGKPLGFGWLFGTTGKGGRSSSNAYFSAAGDRPNLHVLRNVHVTRLLFSEGPELTVTGVEFAESPTGEYLFCRS